MRVVFRADASLQIGSGHVMRCLTLAEALKVKGAECQFICREHKGHLISFIRDKGYVVHVLANAENDEASLLAVSGKSLAHAAWLGVSQKADAEQCKAVLDGLQYDWLIVDHYALDVYWERMLSNHYHYVMVIDDLADRYHHCDLLLDQTFGRNANDYQLLVPARCVLLCGSGYALLRPEFAALRPYSLQRRENPKLEHVLINMGGVDKDNATGQVLDALRSCVLPESCRITVVMGTTAPWFSNVQQRAEQMPWCTEVKVGVDNMAQLMADSDLAIGAAGATSWERCALGVPTMMLVLADNQVLAAKFLKEAGAVILLHIDEFLEISFFEYFGGITSTPDSLIMMSMCARTITDGEGCQKVSSTLELFNSNC